MDDGDNFMERLLQTGRAAWILAVLFVVTGLVYWFLNRNTVGWDPAGAVMLIALGLAMGFGFWVLLRGSSDL
ncbi:MAG: hypothetical protein ACXVAE_02115 [Candidatus Limnocylindrales bacterium]